MYRFKKSIPVGYIRQGRIYFFSREYYNLSAEEKKRVREAARAAGGAYYDAVLEFVTTDTTHTKVCMKHNISRSTLERAVRRYYTYMDKKISHPGSGR